MLIYLDKCTYPDYNDLACFGSIFTMLCLVTAYFTMQVKDTSSSEASGCSAHGVSVVPLLSVRLSVCLFVCLSVCVCVQRYCFRQGLQLTLSTFCSEELLKC